MWLLVQSSINNGHTKRVKYISSMSYDCLIKYINNFINIKRYDDYNFVSLGGEIITFKIELTELLDR